MSAIEDNGNGAQGNKYTNTCLPVSLSTLSQRNNNYVKNEESSRRWRRSSLTGRRVTRHGRRQYGQLNGPDAQVAGRDGKDPKYLGRRRSDRDLGRRHGDCSCYWRAG